MMLSPSFRRRFRKLRFLMTANRFGSRGRIEWWEGGDGNVFPDLGAVRTRDT